MATMALVEFLRRPVFSVRRPEAEGRSIAEQIRDPARRSSRVPDKRSFGADLQELRATYATLRDLGRLGLPMGTNRISTRLPSAAAIRRSIAREWPS